MGTESTSAAPSDAPAPAPDELCGYPVDCALNPGNTSYLAIGPGGRGVVLKRMAAECVVNGQLHPSIKERLTRVRELAHAGIANLHGVGRDGEVAWMIWEYVDGQTFRHHVAAPRTPRELASLGRELALTVEALHMQGVVHGAIHPANVFISPHGTVRLSHVSPMLYTDPAADADAVIELVQTAAVAHGGRRAKWPLVKVLDEAAADGWPLRALAARLAALVESRQSNGRPTPSAIPHSRDDERRQHRRSLLAAFVVLMLGFAGAFTIWYYVGEPGRPQIEQWIEPVRAKLR